VRLHAHFRIRAHLQSFVRKVRRWSVTVFILSLLFAGMVVGKTVVLKDLERELHKYIFYSRLQVSYFPPALVLDDVKSPEGPTAFVVRRVRVEIPFLSLLRSERSVSVVLESPEIRLTPKALGRGPGGQRRALSLPFSIGRGLILDGSVSYETVSSSLNVRGLRAQFTQRGDEFTLKALSDESTFTSYEDRLGIGGRLNVALAGKGDTIKVQRFSVEGPDLVVKADGEVKTLASPEFDLAVRFEAGMSYAGPLLRLPFPVQGKVDGQGRLARGAGGLEFSGQIAADRVAVSGVSMGRMSGRLSINKADGGRVDLEFRPAGRPAELLNVAFGGGRVNGEFQAVRADPVMTEIKIPWPVKSPAWGTFTVEKGRVEVEAEFRDEDMERTGNLFPFRGPLSVVYDSKAGTVEIAAPDLQTSFARLQSRTALHLKGDIDAQIRGSILDLRESREFLALILDTSFDFPEIRGAGYADVNLSGRSDNPRVAFKGTFSPAGFDLFDVAFTDGQGVIFGKTFEGLFHVEDPELKGDVRVSVAPDLTDADFKNADAELGKVLSGLEIPLQLSGRASGDFKMTLTPGGENVTGTFSSPEIRGYGLKADNVKGTLAWKDGILSFPEIGLELYGGRVGGRALLGPESGTFDADLRAEGVDLARVSPRLAGQLSLSLGGRGVFGRDLLKGRFTARDLSVPLVSKTEAEGEVSVGYAQDSITLEAEAAFSPGDNRASGRFDLSTTADAVSGHATGRWTNLDLVLPWTGAKGALDFEADVSGRRTSPEVVGTVGFRGPLMPFPRFAQALTDYSGTARVQAGHVFISDFKATFGGGEIKASGDIGLGPEGIETIDAGFSGTDMQFSALPRARALVDGEARLLKDDRQFVLDGSFQVKQLLWRREIYEGFAFSSETSLNAAREPSFFDDLSLNLRLRSPGNAVMDNSLGNVSVRFDLSLTGNVNSPVLLGDIEILRGTLDFQDQDFWIIDGRVGFFNPASTEPYLEIKAEAYVKDYRVTLTLTGPPSRLRPEFASSPPMPPEDILALLALGEAFQRTYTFNPERSSTLSTASLLSFQIADQAKKRAQGLFTLDRFRVDPFVTGSSAEMTARLTLGKKFSKNVLFIYSTNLAAQRDEIYRMEWDVRPDFSLIGLRDEYGRISFSLRYRKRF